MLWLPLRDGGVRMRQRVGLDAELAGSGVRQLPAPSDSARRGQIVPSDDVHSMTELGPRGEAGPVTYSYSRVEERWEIRLQPDGSARASVVVRREQQVSTDEHWRFVARRGLPGESLRRMRRRIAAGTAALVALVAGGWLAWSHWPRAASAQQMVTIPIARAPSAASPPAMVPPPASAPPRSIPPVAARAVERARPTPPAAVPRVPVVLPAGSVVADMPALPSGAGEILPLDRRASVQAAISRAFVSGEAEAWSDGDLSGFIVVGPVELADGGNCRNTVILTRGGVGGDRTTSHRRCQAANGSITIRDR